MLFSCCRVSCLLLFWVVTASRTEKPKMHTKCIYIFNADWIGLHFWWVGRLAFTLHRWWSLTYLLVTSLFNRWRWSCLGDYKVDLLKSVCMLWVWLFCHLKLATPQWSKASICCNLLLYIQYLTVNTIIKISLCVWHKMALSLLKKDGCD